MSTPESLRAEYEQVNENFRALADIRFKLVALVPSVGGAAAYLLTSLAARGADHGLVLAIALMGFSATFGITMYDLRNSELYNALGGRAKVIEGLLGLVAGQFVSRPKRGRRLLYFRLGHDPGLALIYAPVLGAWFYPGAVAASRLAGLDHDAARTLGFWAAGLTTLLFLEEFLRIDGVWGRLLRRLRM